eukprot:6679060-Lingulodinium_polyedra.AAC.1
MRSQPQDAIQFSKQTCTIRLCNSSHRQLVDGLSQVCADGRTLGMTHLEPGFPKLHSPDGLCPGQGALGVLAGTG